MTEVVLPQPEEEETPLRVSNDGFVMYNASPEEIAMIWERMEEMANAPKEPMGQRQPGERCMYEIQRAESKGLRTPNQQ